MVSIMAAQAALIVLAAILFSAYWVLGNRRRKYRLPPGPKPWPVVGNLPLLASKGNHAPWEVKLAELAKIYGPIMQLKLGSVPTVVITSPELAQVVLKEQDLVFATRPAPSYAVRELADTVEGIGFSPYGPSWRFSRSVLTQQLLTHKRIEQFQPVRQEETDAMVRAIRHSALTKPGGSVDLVPSFRAATFNTLTRIALGKRYICQQGESVPESDSQSKLQTDPKGKERDIYWEVVGDAARLVSTTRMVGDFLPMLSFVDRLRSGVKKELRDNFASADAFFQQVLDEHRVNHELHPDEPARDVLDVLLNLRYTTGEPLTDKRIKALAKGMVQGGADTSTMSLKSVLVDLLREPKYLELAQEELDRVVGRGRRLEESDVPNLPLLQAIVKESLRLTGTMLLPRCSRQDTQVAGYHIPKDTTVLVNLYGICHDPAVWPDPDRFFPDRFLQRPDIEFKSFQLLAFGSGRRSCPGINLGTAMVEITLARLLHSFNLALPEEPQQDLMTAATRWITRIMVVASPRLPSHLY